jgi:hypothetical protein
MTAFQRSLGHIWGFPPVRNLTGALSFLKEGANGVQGAAIDANERPRPGNGRKLRANAEPLAVRGRIDDEFVVGPLRRSEGVLSEAHQTIVRMVEQA